MKRLVLGLMMLTWANSPLAVAQLSKAEKIAFDMAVSQCAVEEGFLLPERGKQYWGWLLALGIDQGHYTKQEVHRIVNETSFKDLTNTLIEYLGGCPEIAKDSKDITHKFLRWRDKNY